MKFTTPHRRKTSPLRWMAVASLVVAAFLLNEVAGRSGYIARHQKLERIQSLNAEIGQLRGENQRLSKRIEDLRSNPNAIEELAREQLHLGRPGEVVVTLPPAPSDPSSAR